jgi:uncharacterized protein (DUF488 family)
MTTILTIGHGTLGAESFTDLLTGAGVERLVDVRRFPASRHNPQFSRDVLEDVMPAVGVAYLWLESLGGRRPATPESPHVALRNDAFRAYADHMQTPAFLAGVEELEQLASGSLTAVLCSESVWWRCHRRLLADHLVLIRGFDVAHLMHDGRRTPHPLTGGVRREDGVLIYDVGSAPD